MTMLAKYNSKINSPDIWLTPLVLVISYSCKYEFRKYWWSKRKLTYPMIPLSRYLHHDRWSISKWAHDQILLHRNWWDSNAPTKSARIFTTSESFDRHTQKDVGALFASLTLCREIVSRNRRADVTTSVIKHIPHTGKQCACIWIQRMTATLNFKN